MLPHLKTSEIRDFWVRSGIRSIPDGCGLFGILGLQNLKDFDSAQEPCSWHDPKSKTLKLLPHSKECGFRFMDIKR